MNEFIQRHQDSVIGMLSGFDRLRIRGTLRLSSYVRGMGQYLGLVKVLLKDFKQYAPETTDEIRQVTVHLAEAAGRPLHYLASSQVSKEQVACRIAERDGIREGLIAVLICVEPCRSYKIYRNRQIKQLELRSTPTKCLHYYFYLFHPRWGFMHLRLQTWFPFVVQLCLNGRAWLARQMDAAGLGYLRRENCFVRIEDLAGSQRLANQQLRMKWPREVDRLLAWVHPSHRRIFRQAPVA